MRETLIRFGMALATKITSDKVTQAQRTVIGICERIPELGARFYERGPKSGHDKLMSYPARAPPARAQLAIDDLELAAYQFTDLCLAGYYRQCLFGYRTEAPSIDEIRKTVTSGVDVFLKAYGGPKAGRSGRRCLIRLAAIPVRRKSARDALFARRCESAWQLLPLRKCGSRMRRDCALAATQSRLAQLLIAVTIAPRSSSSPSPFSDDVDSTPG